MSAAEQIWIPRKVWTRAEVERLATLGFPNLEALELIQGDLIDRMGKKHPHIHWQLVFRNWLEQQFGPEHVWSEAPIDVAPEDHPTSEPEPDLIVTYRSFREFTDQPKPDDLRLVVEISDATVWFDRNVKAGLYARAGIACYWVLDLPGRKLVVHGAPVEGTYAEKREYDFDQEITFANRTFRIDRL